MADHPQTKSDRNPVPLDYDPLKAGDPSGLCQGGLLDYVTCIRDAARNSVAGRNIYQTALRFADAAGGAVRAVVGLTGAVVASTAGCPFQAGGCAGVWGRDVAAAQKVSAEAGYAWQHPAEAAAIISVGGVEPGAHGDQGGGGGEHLPRAGRADLRRGDGGERRGARAGAGPDGAAGAGGGAGGGHAGDAGGGGEPGGGGRGEGEHRGGARLGHGDLDGGGHRFRPGGR